MEKHWIRGSLRIRTAIFLFLKNDAIWNLDLDAHAKKKTANSPWNFTCRRLCMLFHFCSSVTSRIYSEYSIPNKAKQSYSSIKVLTCLFLHDKIL